MGEPPQAHTANSLQKLLATRYASLHASRSAGCSCSALTGPGSASGAWVTQCALSGCASSPSLAPPSALLRAAHLTTAVHMDVSVGWEPSNAWGLQAMAEPDGQEALLAGLADGSVLRMRVGGASPVVLLQHSTGIRCHTPAAFAFMRRSHASHVFSFCAACELPGRGASVQVVGLGMRVHRQCRAMRASHHESCTVPI